MPGLQTSGQQQTSRRLPDAVPAMLRPVGSVGQTIAPATGSHADSHRAIPGHTAPASHSGLAHTDLFDREIDAQSRDVDLNILGIKMAEPVIFVIPGEPVAKGRARSFIRNGRIAHYTPDKTARYENLVKLSAQQVMGDTAPTDGAVALIVRAFMSIPTSWSQKKQRAAALGKLAPTTRPDLDNIVKAIKDGANGITWKDDSQVVDVCASKRYGMPRVEVEVRAIGETA